MIGSNSRRGSAIVAVLALFALGGCAMGGAPLIDEEPRTPPVEQGLGEPVGLAVARGEALLISQQYEAAQTKFNKVLAMEPDNFPAILGLAEAQLGLRQLGDALAGFEGVMESDETRARALQGRGITLTLMGRGELGLPLLRQAVEQDPGLWRAWNVIGRNHALEGDVEKALTSYDLALLANGQAASVYNNRGMTLIMTMRYSEAESSFRHALALDPALMAAKMNLRLALAWQGRYDEAVTELKRGDAPRVLNNIGFVAMERGDFATAKMLFTKAMEISPSYYPIAAKNLEALKERKKLAATLPEAMG
jgi:tetratricopeptide (TPR) repeat protein